MISRSFVSIFGKSSKSFATAKGNLYTWGQYASGTGFDSPSQVPRKLDAFNNNVVKVSMGPFHTAVVTNEGALYTFGLGEKGALGNGVSQFEHTPSQVTFFSENKLKVKDVIAGESYTVAITENGDVYSWGQGGQPKHAINLDCIRNIILPERCGGLGSGNNKNRSTPQTIQNLKAVDHKQLSGGDHFVNLITKTGEVINWGSGVQGCIGNGSDYPLFSPEVNEFFKDLKETKGLSVVSIKSAAHFSVALLSNGQLYSYGSNTAGQLGIRENLGHNTDEVARLPTPVNNVSFSGQKVVDFEVGENSLVFLTETNEVYFSGLELVFMPIRWQIPTDQKIVKLAASNNSFAALTEQGKIYQFNEFISETLLTYEVGSQYNVVDNTSFGGKVVDFGGSYGTRFAIVN